MYTCIIHSCHSLVDFNAAKNQIAYVPSGLFGLPEISSINLSYNLLQRLPGKSLHIKNTLVHAMSSHMCHCMSTHH